MEQWYTVHTKAHSEHQVAATLQERGLETYFPKITSPNLASNQTNTPLFPCYIFVKINFKRISLSRIRWIPGFRNIVTSDNRPIPVPGEVIRLLQQKLEEHPTDPRVVKYAFQAGESVCITEGPFAGMVAIFEGVLPPDQRVQVLLNILGGRRVEVDPTHLKKVSGELSTRHRRTRGRGRYIQYQAN